MRSVRKAAAGVTKASGCLTHHYEQGVALDLTSPWGPPFGWPRRGNTQEHTIANLIHARAGRVSVLHAQWQAAKPVQLLRKEQRALGTRGW